MSMLIAPPGSAWPMPPMPVRRFTVDEYHRMIENGILTEDDPVELLDGWITQKMPRTPSHDVTVDLVPDVLRPMLPSKWRIRIQLAITTPESEPEPDLAVVEGPATRYAKCHPTPAEIGALIEVAESSLQSDRTEKGKLFARAKIPQYWIVNLPDRQIEVYSDPIGAGEAAHYRQRTDFRAGSTIPLVLDGQVVANIPVNDLLPPP